MILKRFVVLLCVGLTSCATWDLVGTSRREPTSAVSLSAESSPEVENIVILGTNDIHGALFPLELRTKEKETSTEVAYTSGGATVLSHYIRQLRSRLGNRLIWLDGGDEFQGTLDSNLFGGAPMVSFFNQMGLNAAAIGNHEFDFGRDTLYARMREAKYPYLVANMVEKKSGQLPKEFPNTKQSHLVQAGRVKVGVIGLLTVETPHTTRYDAVQDLQFQELKSAVLKESKNLREQGAQVVAVVAHSGLFCDTEPGFAGHQLRHPGDTQGKCKEDGEIVKLLHQVPAGTVDAVVSGHTHQVIHHFVAGVPVIQGGARGHYFNLVHLRYSLKDQKLLSDQSMIEGPVPVCTRVFENQGDCNGDRPRPAEGRGSLVRHRFLGERVAPDAEMSALLQGVAEKVEPLKQRVLGRAEQALTNDRNKESALGNFVADSMRQEMGTDFALMNPGGLRESIPSGEITYERLFRTLPFDNTVMKIRTTGKELKLLLRIAQSGAKGFYSVSGVRLWLLDLSVDAPTEDLDKNGQIEAWEVNRFVDAQLEDGSPIEDGKTYTVATLDFLVQGGVYMHWWMSRLKPEQISYDKTPLLREVVERAIVEHKGPLNSVSAPLVSGTAPRLNWVKEARQRPKKKAALRHRRSPQSVKRRR